MFTIQIANITVRIHHRYAYVYHFCKNYRVSDDVTPNLEISVSEEEIQKELAAYDFPATPDYAECVCVYRQICSQIPVLFRAFLFHGALIEYEGRGYVFAARSGTGKSTHIALWQKHFGEGVRVINGDKPIMRFEGDALYGYGTPWCGKEGMETNASVPVRAICFLERGLKNKIQKISAADAVVRVMGQVLTPTDIPSLDAMFPLLDRMLAEIPCYLLTCNMEEEAAEVAYAEMSTQKERIET